MFGRFAGFFGHREAFFCIPPVRLYLVHRRAPKCRLSAKSSKMIIQIFIATAKLARYPVSN
jgi:hypothetical protein